jgi:GH18 family chitinase
MKITGKPLALVVLSVILLSCGTKNTLPPLHTGELRCVGYIPTWRYDFYETLDWNALTHVNIAFCNPDTMGDFQNPFRRDPEDFHRIVSKAHENGVKVLASLGGGSGGRYYTTLIETEQGRKEFNAKLMNFVNEYRLDGIDLDLEQGPGHPFWTHYEPWVIELRKLCSERGVLLTTAVSTWFSDRISDATFACFDFVNIMAYDGPFAAHSTMEMTQRMARHYHERRGIKPADIVIGVPFYGYPSDGGFRDARGYRDIVTQYPDAWKNDHVGNLGYNGANTIRDKSRLARRYGGIMIWELSFDATGNRSLLDVIKKNLFKTGTAPRSVR